MVVGILDMSEHTPHAQCIELFRAVVQSWMAPPIELIIIFLREKAFHVPARAVIVHQLCCTAESKPIYQLNCA